MKTFGLILISACVFIGCLLYCLWYFENRFKLKKVSKKDMLLELVYWTLLSIMVLIVIMGGGAIVIYVAMSLNAILKYLGVPMISLFLV